MQLLSLVLFLFAVLSVHGKPPVKPSEVNEVNGEALFTFLLVVGPLLQGPGGV